MRTVTVLLVGLVVVLSLTAETRTAVAQTLSDRCFDENSKARLRRLAADGERITRAIIRKDSSVILQYVDRSGVTVGVDQEPTRKQVAEQLKLRTGYVYATLFDTRQLRKMPGTYNRTTGELEVTSDISIHDHFKAARWIVVQAELTGCDPNGKDLTARLSFLWEKRPLKGQYYDPTFVYTSAGWKFFDFFNNPSENFVPETDTGRE